MQCGPRFLVWMEEDVPPPTGPGGPPAALPTAGLLGLGSLLGVMIAVCLTLLIVLTNRWSKE